MTRVQGPGEKRKNITTDITENENINRERERERERERDKEKASHNATYKEMAARNDGVQGRGRKCSLERGGGKESTCVCVFMFMYACACSVHVHVYEREKERETDDSKGKSNGILLLGKT